MKQYINSAFLYAVLAMVGGVFYREYTKFNNFTDRTTLGVVHTHYFILGMFFFLFLLILEKNFAFTTAKTKKILVAYHFGLNLTVLMLFIRGIIIVKNLELSSRFNAMISGFAGLGHIILAVSLLVLLKQIKQGVIKNTK